VRLTKVGESEGGQDNPTGTEALPPAASEPGDLLVLAVMGAAVLTSDEWETQLYLGSGEFARGWGVYTKFAQAGHGSHDDGATLLWNTTSLIGALFRGWEMVAYRGVKALEPPVGYDIGGYDPAIPDSAFGRIPSSDHMPTKATWPAVAPGSLTEYQAAIAVVGTAMGGAVAGHATGDVNGVWTFHDFQQLGRVGSSFYRWESPELPQRAPFGAGKLTLTGSRPGWVTTVLPVTLSDEVRAVTRQYPRDSHGLAAAQRQFPPPRGRRIVGGHQ
jgi:hypothetical protein